MRFQPDRSLMDIIDGSKIEECNEVSNPQNSELDIPVAVANSQEKKIFLADVKRNFSSFSIVCHEAGHIADAHIDNLAAILPNFDQIKLMTIDFTAEEIQAFRAFFERGTPFTFSIINSVSKKIIGKLIGGQSLEYQLFAASTESIIEAIKKRNPFVEKISKTGQDGGDYVAMRFNIYDKRLKRVEVIGAYFEFAATQIMENTFRKLKWTEGEIILQDYLTGNPAYARARKLAMRLLEKNYVPQNSGVL